MVRTPEQVFFRYDLAGPVERACAYLVDLACLLGLFTAAQLVLSSAAGLLALPLLLIVLFLIQWGYFLFFEWRWNGATPGKRLLGLRVIQSAGVRCSFERLALRNFLRVVDWLPFFYALGGLATLLSPRVQRLGDLAAGTLCIKVPRRPPPEALAEIRTRYNSLRDDPGLRVRIRQVLAPREAELVLGLALRRELLDAQPRRELMAGTASYLRRRLRMSELPTLSDERLVLNVAAVLLEERVL